MLQEDMIVDHSLSVIAACAKYAPNMSHFSECSLVVSLCSFMVNANVECNIKKQAWSAMIHIHHNDRLQILPHTTILNVHQTNTQQQKFYYR